MSWRSDFRQLFGVAGLTAAVLALLWTDAEWNEATAPPVPEPVELIALPPAVEEPPPSEPARQPALDYPEKLVQAELVQLGRLRRFPSVEASFAMPVDSYLGTMQGAGARVVVYDDIERLVLGVLQGETLSRDRSLKGFSARARDFTDDLDAATRQRLQAVATKDHAASRLLLMLPEALEKRMLSRLSLALKDQGIILSGGELIKLEYVRQEGAVCARVVSVVQAGQELRVNVTVKLVG